MVWKGLVMVAGTAKPAILRPSLVWQPAAFITAAMRVLSPTVGGSALVIEARRTYTVCALYPG